MSENELHQIQQENPVKDHTKKELVFALLGNPNCGKTTLYNSLTGANAYVGNWPGVTVEKRSGVYQNEKIGKATIIDLPGIYSLSPYSPEEVVSRNFLLQENPDLIINVVDGTNLERNLYMTTQLLELDIPMIVVINMMDMLKKEGKEIDCDSLSKKLGVPVIEVSALKRENLDEMMRVALDISQKKRKGVSVLSSSELSSEVDKLVSCYQEEEISSPLFHAVKALERDTLEKESNPKVYQRALSLLEKKEGPLICDLRYHFITKECSSCVITEEKDRFSLSSSDKIDKVLTHRFFGLPIFLLILFFVFELTFSEDLFFLNAFGVFGEEGFNSPLGIIGAGNGIESPGFILANLVTWITDSISAFVGDVLLQNASLWVSSMIVDGLLAGVFAVIGFLPQVLLLFFFFSILEDSGYMARVSYLLDRIFHRFGLSGKMFLPMIMGFGCSVPAMMNTRTLSSEKERTSTIRVIPFFPCSAKLPIIIAVAGALMTSFHIPGSNFILYGVYLTSMIFAVVSILLMHGTTQREKLPPFIMELPSYHLPQFRALMIHVYDKAKHFFKRTFFIILISTFCVWLFSRISFSWEYLGREGIIFAYTEDGLLYASLSSLDGISESVIEELISLGKLDADRLLVDYHAAVEHGLSENFATQEVIPEISRSILGSLGSFITPLFTPMGFGLSSLYTPHVIENGGSFSFVIASLTGLVAKENAISTFGTLASSFHSIIQEVNLPEGVYMVIDAEADEGVKAISAIAQNSFMMNADGSLAYPLETTASLLAFVMFNVTTIPCFAAVGSSRSELSQKSFRGTIVFWLFASYLIGCVTYLVITNWWTIFPLLALLVLTFVIIRIYNHRKDQKACSTRS
ncbi:MAG: ferrous iron transporter B [bacterium]|nr:ferrous iron transporter B [bacterium]